MAGGMDQISRPFLFALIAVVGFAGVWMMVLRPQAADTAAEPAAAVPAAARAQGAVATANAASAAAANATTRAEVPPTARAAPPAAKPQPAPVARTTVLLFAGSGADDAVARGVVRSVRGPGIRVIVAALTDVAKYQELLGAVEIETSPTILVIGKDRQAQRIEGLPDEAQVQQAVRAAR